MGKKKIKEATQNKRKGQISIVHSNSGYAYILFLKHSTAKILRFGSHKPGTVQRENDVEQTGQTETSNGHQIG